MRIDEIKNEIDGINKKKKKKKKKKNGNKKLNKF